MTLTPRDIEDRFEEAAYTLRRLPEKDRPRGYGSSWPPVVNVFWPGRSMPPM